MHKFQIEAPKAMGTPQRGTAGREMPSARATVVAEAA